MRTLLRFLFWAGGILGFLGLAVVVALAVWGAEDFQKGREFSAKHLPFSLILQDRFGEEIYRAFDTENRQWTPLTQIPQDMQDLTLMAEDKRFYSHFGIDVFALSRAIWANVRNGGYSQGASTLTQQLARKAFLTDDKTLLRKAHEAFIALGIERSMTKDEVLEMYLNTAPYGHTVAGVGSASQQYFGVDPAALTPAQMIMMVALPQNPSTLARMKNVRDWLGDCEYDMPAEECTPAHPSYQSGRIDRIIRLYAAEKGMTAKEELALWNEVAALTLPKQKPVIADAFQHFRFAMLQLLSDSNIDPSEYPGGLIITTTLDAELQQETYDHLRENHGGRLFVEFQAENFAATIIDHQTRGPLVWIGSKAFWNEDISGQVDILRSRRMIGSAMKPLVFAQLLQEGYEPNTVFYDQPVQFAGETHRLQNADGLYYGAMGMAKALAQSRNVPAAQAVYVAGGEKKVIEKLDDWFGLGIKETYEDHAFGWTIGLGTAPVRPLDAANAYATLATGERATACPIISITTHQGDEVPNPCASVKTQVLNEYTQFWMWDILSEKKYRPQWYWRDLEMPEYRIAAKTGTSNKRVGNVLLPADNVLAGYTQGASMVLWTGNTSGKPLKSGAFAVQSLSPMWKELWRKVLAKYPSFYAEYEIPEGVRRDRKNWYYVAEHYDPRPWNIPSMKLFTVPVAAPAQVAAPSANTSKPVSIPESMPEVIQQYRAPTIPKADLRQGLLDRLLAP